MRLFAFRQEAVLQAIFIEDLQISQVRVNELGAPRAVYRQDLNRERVLNSRWNRFVSFIAYTWYV